MYPCLPSANLRANAAENQISAITEKIGVEFIRVAAPASHALDAEILLPVPARSSAHRRRSADLSTMNPEPFELLEAWRTDVILLRGRVLVL